MARKYIVFLLVIMCKGNITLAGNSGENGILALPTLLLFSQYMNSDWLVTFPTGKIDGQKGKVQQFRDSKSEESNTVNSVSRTTAITQGSFRKQTSDDGDDKPPLPPEEDRKDPCGAECLPFPLKSTMQRGQEIINFTHILNKNDLQVRSGNSQWFQIPLTQGSSYIQISFHWYSEDGQLFLWLIARASEPLVFSKHKVEIPTSGPNIINLKGEFPSNNQSVLSELQTEVQLLDENEQVLSNVAFESFNNYAPVFQAYNPLGVSDLDMFHHQDTYHDDFFDGEALAIKAPPFPDCTICQSIYNARITYDQWLVSLNEYMKNHEKLQLRIIIKHKQQ